MAFKAILALAILGFVGAATIDKNDFLNNMAEEISFEYEKSIAKIADETEIHVAVGEFERQGEAFEVFEEINNVFEDIVKHLSDKKVSEAAKECLRAQREKAMGFAQETRVKVKACRDSKRDEVNKVRQNGLAAWKEARKNAEALREQAKQCVNTSSNHDECVECLTKVAHAAREGALELAKAIRETLSELRRLGGEVHECSKNALIEFRNNWLQVKKDSAACLELTDN